MRRSDLFRDEGLEIGRKCSVVVKSRGHFRGGGAEAAGAGGFDIGSIIGQIASGGVGGGILMVIVGLIKQAMGGQKAA